MIKKYRGLFFIYNALEAVTFPCSSPPSLRDTSPPGVEELFAQLNRFRLTCKSANKFGFRSLTRNFSFQRRITLAMKIH